MMKPLLTLLFTVVTLTAHAQYSAGSSFSVSTMSPNDSVVHFDARLDESTRWVWIEVRKEAKKEDIFVDTSKQQFPIKSYLKFGPGLYSVQILYSANPQQYSNSYRFGPKYEINNLDQRQDLVLLVPSQNIQSEDPEIVSLAADITHGLESDFDKTQAIHEWVTNNIAYDVNSFFSGSYTHNKHDAVSILRNREAVCEGYSNLTAALNRAVGIPTKKVTGEVRFGNQPWTGKVNHAWNETLIDGRWVIQDTTWDAGAVDFEKKTFVPKPKKKYFDPTPEQFAKDHRTL